MQTHLPVLVTEVIKALNVVKNEWYLDATFGHGGHSREILNKGGKVIAFDIDKEVIKKAKQDFQSELANKDLILVRENFENLKKILEKTRQDHAEIKQISAILFDFGTNTAQLTNQDRGFSFTGDGELDMRLDDRLGVMAKDLLAILSEKQLREVFFQLGGERQARQVAKAIVKHRKLKPLTNSQQLADLVTAVKGPKKGRLHSATKVFQALRIAVNRELEVIKHALPQAVEVVKNQGKVITISFHEGEDRIAKQTFNKLKAENLGKVEKLITPSEEEVKNNPRSRSAKMRVFTKS